MKLPYSLDCERVLLASLIKHPTYIPEIIENLSDELFHLEAHKIIAGAIRHQFSAKKTVDPVILADHISNIGLRIKDDLDLPDYISQITSKSAASIDKIDIYFKECYKYKFVRHTIQACQETQGKLVKSLNSNLSQLISIAESGLAKAVTSDIEEEYKPVDIYKNLPEFIENIAESKEFEGIFTPFKTWNKWFGPLTVGDLSIIAAPPKTGKSTILNYIADAPYCRYNEGKRIKVLILDTELETFRVMTRKVAALAQINESYIKNGEWQKNQEMIDKVQGQFSKMEKRAGFVQHIYVGNTPIDKIGSIVRRWRLTETEPDDLCLVIYDYLKITGEKIDDANKEFQVLGEKCDYLKKLMSELKVAGLCAVQTNQGNDVAASQRIKWFGSNIYRFRKFTPEELSEWGEEFGTHLLEPIETRNQGPAWENEQWVKVAKEKGVVWKQNWLNLEVKNFDMKEKGTLKDILDESSKQIDIKDKKPKIREEDDLL